MAIKAQIAKDGAFYTTTKKKTKQAFKKDV